MMGHDVGKHAPKTLLTSLDEETRRMCRKDKRGSYVAHKPRPDGNVIFDASVGPGCSFRLMETSLKTFSNLAALYLCLVPNPNRSVVIIRGLPNTSCPSLRYSKRQSGMVIRKRPSMIAIRLRRFSVKSISEEDKILTLRYSSRICDRNNDREDICECEAERGAALAYRRPPCMSVAHFLLEELEKQCRAKFLDESCDNFHTFPPQCLCNR